MHWTQKSSLRNRNGIKNGRDLPPADISHPRVPPVPAFQQIFTLSVLRAFLLTVPSAWVTYFLVPNQVHLKGRFIRMALLTTPNSH